MVSHGLAGGDLGIEERGQASPRGMESTWVREGGHMGARPSIRTCQRVVRGTTGTDDIDVAGWDRK